MKLLYPVPKSCPITQTFDEHVEYAKQNGLCYQPGNCPSGKYYYGGIDFYVPNGTPVIAAMGGTVYSVKIESGGYGRNVKVSSDDGGKYINVYAHLMDFSVAVGQHVNAGDQIGLSDNTGNSTGPHLHFELRENGIPIDPMPYLTDDVPVEPPQPMECNVPPIPKLVSVTTTPTVTKWVNLRTEPREESRDIGNVNPGTIWFLYAAAMDKHGNVWFGITDTYKTGWAAACFEGEVWLQECKEE